MAPRGREERRGEAGRPETLGGAKARAFCRVPSPSRAASVARWGVEEEPEKGTIGRRRLSKNLAR
jgi:hypothetical protein